MWGLCALKDHRKMTELVEEVGFDSLLRGCPPVELGYIAHYMSVDRGSSRLSTRLAGEAAYRMVQGGEVADIGSLLVALRVFTDRNFAERAGADDLADFNWTLLVPALRVLSSPEVLERIGNEDLINCLLSAGIAKSFENAPKILAVFLKVAEERLQGTDEVESLEDCGKVYRAACRNILGDDGDAARVRESMGSKFEDGKLLMKIPIRMSV
ncbi:hypothetical protein Pmar_PMAR008595 [Perkinsus marinus ATCC 50983]|uniref:Uncharacterized protein n=1 Tax=Perkinsus marinus (strain ATCC 50983 / TXsc) TaxID=423536 RepID=C5L7Y1_PERM5|nr:hypothetical protein Pmar_PMAR008595 [Perkinsus marinus ATCC 50983]EER07161.1 hypothetical protein Pmar_PMAR008595 [Perkinsus marinus ATCC 50983]|eukprot:XP_002775345.1 hypothetical protein Pmar_PMAR008595 [Perkinsus marinus ATCC 50983]